MVGANSRANISRSFSLVISRHASGCRVPLTLPAGVGRGIPAVVVGTASQQGRPRPEPGRHDGDDIGSRHGPDQPRVDAVRRVVPLDPPTAVLWMRKAFD